MIRSETALSPDAYLRDIFSAKAVANGLLVRRKLRDIERYVGMDRFLTEVRERGFRAVENRGQVIVFCNQAPVRPLA